MFLIGFIFSAFAGGPDPDEWKTHTRIIMAVPITVSLHQRDSRHLEPVFDVFRSIDGDLSSYNDESEIGRLNRLKIGKVSSRTHLALTRALDLARRTDGLFDPTIGSLTFKKGGREAVDYNKVKLGNPVRMASDSFLDLGGIGKGFAVDLAAEYLKERKVGRALLAASGDIRCLGGCVFAIQHPFRVDAELLKARSIADLAISTSGTYERKHLLDPKTGKPAQVFRSVTLASRSDNTTLDALATAISVAGREQALRLLETFHGIEFLLVTESREILVSQGFWSLAEEPVWSADKAAFKITTVTAKKKN